MACHLFLLIIDSVVTMILIPVPYAYGETHRKTELQHYIVVCAMVVLESPCLGPSPGIVMM
jgi:hypothetical protein